MKKRKQREEKKSVPSKYAAQTKNGNRSGVGMVAQMNKRKEGESSKTKIIEQMGKWRISIPKTGKRREAQGSRSKHLQSPCARWPRHVYHRHYAFNSEQNPKSRGQLRKTFHLLWSSWRVINNHTSWGATDSTDEHTDIPDEADMTNKHWRVKGSARSDGDIGSSKASKHYRQLPSQTVKPLEPIKAPLLGKGVTTIALTTPNG